MGRKMIFLLMKWREREESGVYEGGWVGRMMRGVKRHKLRGERWEVEKEREGNGGWKIRIGKDKVEAERDWRREMEERRKDWIVAVSDAGGEGRGMGMGGGWWEEGVKKNSWGLNGGCGLTVMMGEMGGVKEAVERVEGEYKGLKRRLMVGVDNVGVLKCLRKGRSFCGEGESGVRRACLRLERKGWEVMFVWVPGHVGIEENEEADELASEGSYDDVEMEEWKDVLGWGKWEERRKKEESRRWKEYWVKERKGEEYFGTGGKGELGHEGERWKSKFLVWMRTNHGRMGGMRYRKDGERCECGGKDGRDHLLLYCKKWEKERKEVWKGWWDGWLGNEGWVEMDRMLFGEEGVKRILKFAEEVRWIKWKFKSELVGKGEEREGELLKPREEGGGGWLRERSEKRRREILERARERAKKSREKGKEMSDKDKEMRREAGRIRDLIYREEAARKEGRILRSRVKEELGKREKELIEKGIRRGERKVMVGRKILGEVKNR